MKSTPIKLFATLLLLTFSLDTVATACVGTDPGVFSTHHKIENHRSNLGVCSWISEVIEKTGDEKECGVAALTPRFILLGSFHGVSKIKSGAYRTFHLVRPQQILRLICRLSI